MGRERMSIRLFDECVAHAQERNTFGQSLIQHQAFAANWPICRRALTRWTLSQSGGRVDECREMPVTEISRIKPCSTNLETIASEAMQIFGGAGYLR